MASGFRLFLENAEPTAPLIALLRRFTGRGMSDLREAIIARQPILDVTPHDRRSTGFHERLAELLDRLETMGIPYTAEVDGMRTSPQQLRTIFQRWDDIRIATWWMADLESGEPGIETLEWLKQTAPCDVFRATLDQIVKGDGYGCDETTLAWVRRELG